MDSFLQYLLGLVGMTVQVERSGPESCRGFLQAVHREYLILVDDWGAPIYLPIHHIRSVSRLEIPDHPLLPLPMETGPDSFQELLRGCLGRLIRVYHAGPELCYGTLVSCGDHHLVLEALDGEQICFATWHLRSLALPTEVIFPDPESEPEPDRGALER